jgi:hypothetical protein
MATRESTDIPRNNHHLVPSAYVFNAGIDCDKELPPMPRPMEADGPDGTEYGESRLENDFQRQSWMDMGSGSESDDTGELHFMFIIWPPLPAGQCAGSSFVSYAAQINPPFLIWVSTSTQPTPMLTSAF